MSSANGDTEATLHSLPSLPTETARNGQCQAPALPNDAERLSAIIATQQEIATAGLDLGTVLTRIAERTQAITGAAGAAVELAEGDELVYRAASGTAAHSLGLRLRMADDRRRSQEVGFDAHLVKPVDPAALQGVLLLEAPA